MVLPAIVAGARVAGTVAARGAQAVTRGAQATTRGASKAMSATGNTAMKGGVQNPAIFRRAIRTAPENFVGKSIGGRASRIRGKNRANSFSNTEQPSQPPQTRREQLQKSLQNRLESVKNKTQKKVARRMSIWLVSVATLSSYWIFVFGFWAFALIWTGNISFFWGAFTVDDIIEFATTPLVWVGVLSEGVTATDTGFMIYFIATGISFLSYFCSLLWYYFAKGQKIDTSMGLAVTAICWAADMTIGLQMFPWLVVWIVAVELGLFSSEKT